MSPTAVVVEPPDPRVRHLCTVFTAATGLTPTAFVRIDRVRTVLARPGPGSARFYDQSPRHFVSGIVIGTAVAMVFRLWAFKRFVFPHAEARPRDTGTGARDRVRTPRQLMDRRQRPASLGRSRSWISALFCRKLCCDTGTSTASRWKPGRSTAPQLIIVALSLAMVSATLS